MKAILGLLGSYALHTVFPFAYKEEEEIIDVNLNNGEVKQKRKETSSKRKETSSKTKEDIKQEKKEAKKNAKERKENINTKKEDVKEQQKETKTEEKKKDITEVEVPIKKKKTSRVTFQMKDDDKITMQNRKVCPVKVPVRGQTNKVEADSKKIEDVKEEEHRLSHLVEHLRNLNVNFTAPQRMSTGLYELDLIQMNGNAVLLSFDINGLLYSDEIKFFIGRVQPGEEYMKPAIMMTRKSIEAIINGVNIPKKYYISENLFNLNKVLDLQTLKEKDKKKRAKVFELAAKVISDPDIYDGILRASNGEAFRFAFCRYNSTDNFSLVSSKRNLSSNLTNDKLLVSKEIWINVNGRDIELITKNK